VSVHCDSYPRIILSCEALRVSCQEYLTRESTDSLFVVCLSSSYLSGHIQSLLTLSMSLSINKLSVKHPVCAWVHLQDHNRKVCIDEASATLSQYPCQQAEIKANV